MRLERSVVEQQEQREIHLAGVVARVLAPGLQLFQPELIAIDLSQHDDAVELLIRRELRELIPEELSLERVDVCQVGFNCGCASVAKAAVVLV
jgi:hypothetical protein